MKFYAACFWAILALPGCRNQSEKTSIPTFSGTWLHYKYPLYLRDMNSTRIVQNAVKITAISFDSKDTSKAWLIFHAHEARPFKIMFLDGRNWQLKGTEGDTTVVSLEIAATRNAVYVGREMFESVPSGNLQLIANQFYAGKYFLDGQPVIFSTNGELIGLDSFVRYAPRLDYTGDEGIGDHIELIGENGFPIRLGVECDGWSFIKIYDLRCLKQQDGACTATAFGKLKYELIKEIKPIAVD